MNLGQRLLELRKSKGLSQEEVADKLNVSRQTISKWETDQSVPDFDKIVPLCELYEITADELLSGKKEERKDSINLSDDAENNKKRALGIGISVFLYFVSLVWIMIAVAFLMMNPIVATAIFFLIIGLATFLIIYINMVYKKKKTPKEEKKNKLIRSIENIVSLFILVIYLLISFITMAWHITWLIWIAYALIMEIVKLIFSLRGEDNEE